MSTAEQKFERGVNSLVESIFLLQPEHIHPSDANLIVDAVKVLEATIKVQQEKINGLEQELKVNRLVTELARKTMKLIIDSNSSGEANAK